MEGHPFSNQVRKHFRYLFDDYGFSVLFEEYSPDIFGNWITLLQSNDCQIRIILDRGQVFIDAGPSLAPNEWFDLNLITAFLAQEPRKANWQYSLPKESIAYDTIDRQLANLADILRKYCDEIIQLFREDTFKQRKTELKEFRRKKSEERWEQLSGRGQASP
jgi:hypothetical protein